MGWGDAGGRIGSLTVPSAMILTPSARLNCMSPDRLSTKATIAAAPERVFAVLTDPGTHAGIDGTGRVRDPLDPARLVTVGQIYRMSMYHPDHPDGEYVTANEVHVFDPPHSIGWRTGYETADGALEFGGWFWRYDLVALTADSTRVTLVYDWSAVPRRIREYLSFPPFGPEHFRESLRHLAQRVLAS